MGAADALTCRESDSVVSCQRAFFGDLGVHMAAYVVVDEPRELHDTQVMVVRKLSPSEGGATQVRVIVHTIVEHDGRMLLRKRRETADRIYGGMWDVPGGLLEIGEDPEAGARRELEEEADLSVADLVPHAVLSNIDQERDVHAITIFYWAAFDGGCVRLATGEHTEFCWRSPRGALELPLVPLLKKVIQRMVG